MSDLLQHIEESIRARRLLPAGHPILVAVSGGLDSMVLLDLLHRLAPKYKWRLTLAHFNHQLRGRSSQADERLVVAIAKKLKLPIVVEHADVRKFARTQKISVEMAARQLRHDFLARTAAQHKIPAVALAHHADDQLELFLLRLLRGSGGKGLAGMKWHSFSPSDPNIQLVRPLLDLPKTALREYSRFRTIRFREDASNSCVDFLRNRIRHELIPLLEQKYQPALDKVIPRVMDIIGAETEVIRDLASAWLKSNSPSAAPVRSPAFRRSRSGLNKSAQTQSQPPKGGTPTFEQLAVAIQRECLQLQLIRLGIAPEFDLVESLRLKPDHPINPGSITGLSLATSTGNPLFLHVSRDSAGLLHLKQPKAADFLPGSLQLNLDDKVRQASFDGVSIRWTLAHGRLAAPKSDEGGGEGARVQWYCQNGRESFDADKVGPRIVLRHWRPGDRFQPIGMSRAVKLQDIFTNLKIPRQCRHELVLAATMLGEVFWVEGLRISEHFKLTNNTKRCLRWAWKRC